MIAVDTDLLVYAHRAATAEHRLAVRALEHAAADSRGWGFSIGNEGRAAIWLPGVDFADRLLDTAARMRVTGGRVFDLQVALTALEHGATEVWTHDAAFVRVPGLRVHDPLRES
jgi:predicted nucleic acid-binding protein